MSSRHACWSGLVILQFEASLAGDRPYKMRCDWLIYPLIVTGRPDGRSVSAYQSNIHEDCIFGVTKRCDLGNGGLLVIAKGQKSDHNQLWFCAPPFPPLLYTALSLSLLYPPSPVTWSCQSLFFFLFSCVKCSLAELREAWCGFYACDDLWPRLLTGIQLFLQKKVIIQRKS